MQRPAVLMFDLGGVLVENVGFERLNALLPESLPSRSSRVVGLLPPQSVRSRSAPVHRTRLRPRLLDEWQLALSPSEFDPSVRFLAEWPVRERLDCLATAQSVHAGLPQQLESHPLGAVSGFNEEFVISLSSHLLGEVKPDAACFKRALQECRAEPSHVAFFDEMRPLMS